MADETRLRLHSEEEMCEAEKWFKSANEKHDRTQYQAAIDEFTMAIRILPDEADYYFFRAVSYQQLGKLRKATSDFEKAIGLNPARMSYHFLCGNVLLQREKYKSALKCIDAALAIDPNYPAAIQLKNEILGKMG